MSLPNHVAVIMDGNGRWASARCLPRIAGHRAGAEALRRTIRAAIKRQVAWLTIYAFSSENWRRPETEVRDLTGLLGHYLRHEVASLKQEGVRLRFIGDRRRFSADIGAALVQAEADTAGNTRLNLTVALSYGSRSEITDAARSLALSVQKGETDPATLDEDAFGRFLLTRDLPDLDLLIRTGGERRLSNFLLWQAAYAELSFLDQLWPDCGEAEFDAALADFAQRERRFGGRLGS